MIDFKINITFQYIQEILRSGEDLEIFIEGGRTRSGRAYHPKGGLLSVVIDTLNEGLYLVQHYLQSVIHIIYGPSWS